MKLYSCRRIRILHYFQQSFLRCSAAAKSGLAVVDVSNPVYMEYVTTCATPGLASDVSIQGNYAYVTDDLEGLQIINISNPAAPFITGSLTVPYSSWHVTAPGNGFAYVTGSGFDLLKVDVSNPAAPVISAYCYSLGSFYKAAFNNGYLYVTNYNLGILVIEP